jgi:hypothetical protein
MAKIICPYTKEFINPATKAIVEKAGGKFVEMTDWDSYWKLFCDLWEKGEGFVLIEHDVVPAKNALQELANCKHDWCSCPLPTGGSSALGCCKVSTEAIKATPKLWDDMPLRHWMYCDNWLNERLQQLYTIHDHQRILEHTTTPKNIKPQSSLVIRTRRRTKDELEISFYDPTIEYEFAAVTLDLNAPAYSTPELQEEFIEGAFNRFIEGLA